MFPLSHIHIETICRALRERGVERQQLQDDLLDHVCCLIEQELEEESDFDAFLNDCLDRFHPHGISGLERETQLLLTFKPYYTMKKLMLIAGGVSFFGLLSGLTFKFMHWPGASVLLLLGMLSMSLVFMPLLVILKIREDATVRDKVVSTIATVAGIIISLSVLFKIMHWPGANVMGVIALGIMLLLFLPIYFFTGIRNPATKVNTIVSSVFIFGGCALLLALIRSSYSQRETYLSNADDVIRTESLLDTQKQQTRLLLSANPVPTAADAETIARLCREIKTYLIRTETGKESLDATSELSEARASDYLSRSVSQERKLSDLKNAISAYNSELSQGLKPVPDVTGLPQKTIGRAVNDLARIEIALLQNQTQEVLSR